MGLCESKADPDGVHEFCGCRKCLQRRRQLARLQQLETSPIRLSFTTASTAPERKALELRAAESQLAEELAHFKTTNCGQDTLDSKDRVLSARDRVVRAKGQCEEMGSAQKIGWRDSTGEPIATCHEVPKSCPSRRRRRASTRSRSPVLFQQQIRRT